MSRESMEFDVVVVGAGPAGLSASIRLMQLSNDNNLDLSVCLLEKGSEIGAHIISGAVIETRSLDELLPDWDEGNNFLQTPVIDDKMLFLTGENTSISVPKFLMPKTMMNHGNRIISLGSMCQYLGREAESLGVNVFPGFPAVDLIEEEGTIVGVITGDMGLDKDGEPKDGYEMGYELRAKQTIFSEGCRGNLGKQLIKKYSLDENSDPQHYGIGFKEVWSIDPEKHSEGLVMHTAGFPLDNNTEGGGFIYHAPNHQVFIGLIVSLDYANPNLSPFEEFQRWKTHSELKELLKDGERISYGARALNKGGIQSIPQLTFPGGVMIGCDAGFMNGAKIKGTHTAMKTGIIAAETYIQSIENETRSDEIDTFEDHLKQSWVFDELHRARNFSPFQKKFGLLLGSIFIWIDQNLFFGKLPFTLSAKGEDYAKLSPFDKAAKKDYLKPDNIVTFDRTSSIYLSGVNHEEDQPCHLHLNDPTIPIQKNLPEFGEPARLYCPAGVYEVLESESGEPYFQINAQNCIHCKTCDIKDPSQNIDWRCPEGAGGPNYTDM
mgnify:FL=1